MTAPSEAEFQAAVVELAQLRQWLYFHDYDSRKNPAGFLDLVFLHPRTGELLFTELKRDGEHPTRAQWRWIDALILGGHRVYIWRPADLRSGAITRALTPSDVARTA